MYYYEELRDSIGEYGLKVPLLVRELAFSRSWYAWFFNSSYELIDGHSRYKACCELGFTTIPVTVIKCTNEQLLEAQIIASTPYVKTKPEDLKRALIRIKEMNPEMTQEELLLRLAWTQEQYDEVMRDG